MVAQLRQVVELLAEKVACSSLMIYQFCQKAPSEVVLWWLEELAHQACAVLLALSVVVQELVQ